MTTMSTVAVFAGVEIAVVAGRGPAAIAATVAEREAVPAKKGSYRGNLKTWIFSCILQKETDKEQKYCTKNTSQKILRIWAKKEL